MEDRVLAARLCAGDDSALAEIFDRHGALLLGLARRVTGSHSLAEEVLQEVMTALWSHPERFDAARGTLRCYLGTVTHRRAVDAVRSAVRRQARESIVESLRLPTDGGDDWDSASMSEAVREAIERLPPDQRQAVELAFWKGMTYREVAQALGLPRGHGQIACSAWRKQSFVGGWRRWRWRRCERRSG